MKKILNPKSIPFIVVAGSIIGLLLRLWTQGGGPNIFGLYPRMPLAWLTLVLFSVALAAAVIVSVRPLDVSGSYSENYPKSILGFIGYLLVGGGVLHNAYEHFRAPAPEMVEVVTIYFDRIAIYFGFVAGALLLALSVFRLLGKKPPFVLHSIVCLYLAVRLFNRCQLWSNESQTGVILVPFAASLMLMLAFYHRATFDVGVGKRPPCLLFTFMSTYLCIMAILSFEDIIFYATWALWMMTNLCSLQPLKETVQTEEVPSGEEEETLKNMSDQELKNWLDDEKQ